MTAPDPSPPTPPDPACKSKVRLTIKVPARHLELLTAAAALRTMRTGRPTGAAQLASEMVARGLADLPPGDLAEIDRIGGAA